MSMYPPLGVDIGKGTLTVSPPGGPAESIPLVGAWHTELARRLDPEGGTVVAFEPTGWHYAAPLITVCELHHANMLQVEHATSKKVRETRFGEQKNDVIDAQTLALIAEEVSHGVFYKGAHWLDPKRLRAAIQLRFVLRAYDRARSVKVRLDNRLQQLSYSIWPVLADRQGTYLRAVRAGSVTPAEVRDLLTRLEAGGKVEGYPTGNHIRHLRDLVRELPRGFNIEVEHIRATIHETLAQYDAADARKDELQKQVNTIIWSEPIAQVTNLWHTVPAAAAMEIAAILAACNCSPGSYSENALAAACRCTMIREKSGKVVKTKRSDRGSKLAKTALHMWVMRLHQEAHRPNPIADYADRLRSAGHKYPMQAARNKLLAILRGIVVNQENCRW